SASTCAARCTPRPPLPPYVLWLQTPPGSSVQPGAKRVVHTLAFADKHARKAAQLSALPEGPSLQRTVGESRSAQRVQSPVVPPQQRPPSHAPLAQSASARHTRPGAQRGHSGSDAPQSRSASSSLSVPSLQVAGWQQVRSVASAQLPGPHTPLSQPASPVQALPAGQTPPQTPPQSTPRSSWLRTPSLHEA